MNDIDTDHNPTPSFAPLKKGRKLGSNDSVLVSIETLLKYIPQKSVVPVRRKWLESLGNLYGVVFVDENPQRKVETAEIPITEEFLGDPRDAVVRPRVEIEETEL